MSDFFYNSLAYGNEIAQQISDNMDKICNECKDKCSGFAMMHRSSCPDMWGKDNKIYEGIDFSKAPTPEEQGMEVIDEIGAFQIVVKKGTELCKKGV